MDTGILSDKINIQYNALRHRLNQHKKAYENMLFAVIRFNNYLSNNDAVLPCKIKKYFDTLLLPLFRAGVLYLEAIDTATENISYLYRNEFITKVAQVCEPEKEISLYKSHRLHINSLIKNKAFIKKTGTKRSRYLYKLNKEYESKIKLKQRLLDKNRDFDKRSRELLSRVEDFKGIILLGFSMINSSKNSEEFFDINPMFNLEWADRVNRLWKQNRINLTYGIYTNGIFYGGRQKSPIDFYLKADDNKKSEIKRIVRKYHPDFSDIQIEDFLKKLDSEGCGYIALINTFLNTYKGSEKEFKEKFGFDMYHIMDGSRVLNYEYLVIDFYANMDNHNRHRVLGIWGKDKINKKEDLDEKTGFGTTQDSREYRFKKYMGNKGIFVDFMNFEDRRNRHRIKANIDNYEKYKELGEIILSVYAPVKFKGLDGAADTFLKDGGHAVTITGKTKDNKFIISSWGKKYEIDPDENINGIMQIIKYKNI